MYNQVQLLLFHDIWSHLSYLNLTNACQHTFVQSGNTKYMCNANFEATTCEVNGVKSRKKCSKIDRLFWGITFFLWTLESWLTPHFKVNFKLFLVMLLSGNKWSHQIFMNMPTSAQASCSCSSHCTEMRNVYLACIRLRYACLGECILNFN